jgi:hypothetical protein
MEIEGNKKTENKEKKIDELKRLTKRSELSRKGVPIYLNSIRLIY